MNSAEPLRLALLGDSIAVGQGASRDGDTPRVRLVEGLAAEGIESTTKVFAISGSRSSALRGQVDRALRWAPDLAVIVIGANDLTHRTPPERAAADLADAVRRLRRSGADVVVAPAPDLSTVPHIPVQLRPVVRAASTLLRDQQIAVTTAHGGHVADLDGATARAFGTDPSLFSADRFHPSSAGYAVITAGLLAAIRRALRVTTEQ